MKGRSYEYDREESHLHSRPRVRTIPILALYHTEKVADVHLPSKQRRSERHEYDESYRPSRKRGHAPHYTDHRRPRPVRDDRSFVDEKVVKKKKRGSTVCEVINLMLNWIGYELRKSRHPRR